MTRDTLIAMLVETANMPRWERFPAHKTKWMRTTATLGADNGYEPMPLDVIAERAERWPDSKWAAVQDFLEANPEVKPPAPEPRADPIRELAEKVYVSYTSAILNRDRSGMSFLAGALAGLGFNDWLLSHGYVGPDTGRRRGRILQALAGYPWFAELAAAGWNHKRRELPMRVGRLSFYARVTDAGVLEWGLGESRRRDLAYARYDNLWLRVEDAGKVVLAVESGDFANELRLADEGLSDDDYRFTVGAEANQGQYPRWKGTGPGSGVPSQARHFDWAVVDGRWTELPWQGHDWDGELDQ